MYRHYPQTPAFYLFCDIYDPQKTSDGGYIFSFFPWSPNLHGPGPFDQYALKVDSVFVPEWKKLADKKVVVLPSGGIISYYNYPLSPQIGMIIEKSTASGVQVWTRKTDPDFILHDGISYHDKVRFVGRKQEAVPFTPFLSYDLPYTLEIDTLGNFVSGSVFSISSTTTCLLTKIRRDTQGNFFVTGNNLSLAKFDPGFQLIWGRTYLSTGGVVSLRDLDTLPGGRLFATGFTGNGSGQGLGSLLKFDSQGNLLSQRVFNHRHKISGLCKKANGNYLVSMGRADSLFLAEADTSMNLLWNKLIARGLEAGTSVIRNNQVYTPVFSGSDPVIVSSDLSGNSCRSASLPYSIYIPTLTPVNFSLMPSLLSSTLSPVVVSNSPVAQSYKDSCLCPVSIPVNQSTLCVGNTGTIQIAGTGALSWYASPAGNSFIQAGPQFVYSSQTPTSLTVYAQDSACTANPHRTPVHIIVHAVPVLSFSPQSPSLCAGSQVFVSAAGANSYTWSQVPALYNHQALQSLNPVINTTYTVTGSLAPGCSDTKTLAVTVIPQPSLSISPPATICLGSSATLSISGANTYTWIGLFSQASSVQVAPGFPSAYVYTVMGTDASSCHATAQTTLTVLPSPNISVSGSPSLCAGNTSTLSAQGASSYTWNTSSGHSSIVVSPPATTTYSVSGSLFNGCTRSETFQVTVFPSPALSAGPQSSSVCEGASITFSATGASSYSWSNGQTFATFSLSAPPGASTYTVYGTDGLCTDSVVLSLFSTPVPTINVWSNPPVFCEGQTTTLNASGAGSYLWDQSVTQPSFVITALGPSSHTIRGMNGACFRDSVIHILPSPNPTLSLSVSAYSICLGDSLFLYASGALSYSWNGTPGPASLSLLPGSTSGYTLSGSNLNGCISTTAIIQYVEVCTGLMERLNPARFIDVFPNPGTGYYTIRASTLPEQATLSLYNPAGQLLYQRRLDQLLSGIDIRHLGAGIYYLVVNGSEHSFTFKLFKE
jgi:hypothetical protein